MNNVLTLTLVIPVYNEERHLKSCLEAVARQTVMPDEVIVVDNNSTDKSVAIARSFPFVKVVREPVQGLIAARNHGFRMARGTIIGRIDADAKIAPTWVERLQKDFADPEVAAITGLAYTKAMRATRLTTRLWSYMYFLMREADFKIHLLWGANMALRKSAWEAIKQDACLDDSEVHEDQDLSFLLIARGQKIVRDNKLLITTNGDEYNELPKFIEYMQRARATKRRHAVAMRSALAGELQLLPAERLWRLVLILLPALLFTGLSLVHYALHGHGNSLRYKAGSEEVY